MRLHPFRHRRFSAYELAGAFWVTIEWLALTDEPNVRWLWAVRTIQFRTERGAVVPSRAPFVRGYAWTKAEARARAYHAALDHKE